MIHQVTDMSGVAPLFDSWGPRLVTLIWSCLQGCSGTAWADDAAQPQSARIDNCGFVFLAGVPTAELLETVQVGQVLVPQNEAWAAAIEDFFGGRAEREIRYATEKEPEAFDKAQLERFAATLPEGYGLTAIDEALFDRLRGEEWSADLVAAFPDFAAFSANGLGIAAVKDGVPAAGAGTYCFYRGGIEIEIDTRQDARRQGLARACGAALMLECLARRLYPSWDAHNEASLALAKQLGYRSAGEYEVWSVTRAASKR